MNVYYLTVNQCASFGLEVYGMCYMSSLSFFISIFRYINIMGGGIIILEICSDSTDA